jgi:Na+/H+ antiporter NhaD/arsenite permease-like protein
MTYINTMDERGIFDALRVWLVTRGFSLRKIFWFTGVLAFFISPIADNLTTLMVWQKGIVQFEEFFVLFVPSVVNWLVAAVILGLTVPSSAPEECHEEARLQHGAWFVVALFILTITMALSAHNFLHLPPVLGMMTGLGFLKLFGYYLKRRANFFPQLPPADELGGGALELEQYPPANDQTPYKCFKSLERAEWDTLMFFYGIILCVGGLGTLGYLAVGSQLMYGDLGPTQANILVGILSAIIDNIPVMLAVLAMEPAMDHGQWLLVTLTAGVGGSLLSIGSAARVAVMGQARGIYTFFAHL